MSRQSSTQRPDTPFISWWHRRRRTVSALTVLFAWAWAAGAASAASFLLEIETSPENAGHMQSHAVNVVADVDEDSLFGFIRDCHLRADLRPRSPWSVITVSSDDLLQCRSQATPAAVEMDIQILTPIVLYDEGAVHDAGLPSDVVGHFVPERGYEQRLRFGHGAQAWTGWTTGSILRSIRVPPEGEENALHFEVELRPRGSAATSAMSGYIKTKKLNSGD